MYSLEVIRRMNRVAAAEARRRETEPVRIAPEEIAEFPPFPIPFVGNARFRGC